MAARITSDKRFNDFLALMIGAGWKLEPGGKHWKIRSPDGRGMITFSYSPSDHRAALNFRSDCRRQCNRLGIPCPL